MLAPLHNPANQGNFNRRGHFLVKRIKLHSFDTAFHQTIQR
jgi:acetate kinase